MKGSNPEVQPQASGVLLPDAWRPATKFWSPLSSAQASGVLLPGALRPATKLFQPLKFSRSE